MRNGFVETWAFWVLVTAYGLNIFSFAAAGFGYLGAIILFFAVLFLINLLRRHYKTYAIPNQDRTSGSHPIDDKPSLVGANKALISGFLLFIPVLFWMMKFVTLHDEHLRVAIVGFLLFGIGVALQIVAYFMPR